MASAGNSNETVRSNIDTLKLAMERGSVRAVSNLLGHRTFPGMMEAAGPEARAAIDAARAWLPEAAAFERNHGAGSRLDRSHPWNVEYMPEIERYLAQRGLSL